MYHWVLLAAAASGVAPDAAECAGIADDRQRLACYDAASGHASVPSIPPGATASPPASGAAAPAPAAAPAAPANPEAEFGLSAIAKEKRSGTNSLDRIRSIVTEVVSNRSGKDAFRLENGQRWIQTEVPAQPVVMSGDVVEIRRASMGSFLASVPGSGRPAVRVRRLE